MGCVSSTSGEHTADKEVTDDERVDHHKRPKLTNKTECDDTKSDPDIHTYDSNSDNKQNLQASMKKNNNSGYDSLLKDGLILGLWKIGEIIGTGSFCTVHKATNIRAKSIVAVKFTTRNKNSLHDEVEILKQLKRLQHPNIIKLFKSVQECDDINPVKSDDHDTYQPVLIVMEYAPNGKLFDILRYCSPLSDGIAKIYFNQIISALKAIHSQNIIHGDLKPENVLLDKNFNIKICGFGLSKILTF